MIELTGVKPSMRNESIALVDAVLPKLSHSLPSVEATSSAQ